MLVVASLAACAAGGADGDDYVDANPDEIGPYQIAERAGVPPASVYQFFPTKEAAYQALAERYLDGLLEVHAQTIEARLIQTW